MYQLIILLFLTSMNFSSSEEFNLEVLHNTTIPISYVVDRSGFILRSYIRVEYELPLNITQNLIIERFKNGSLTSRDVASCSRITIDGIATTFLDPQKINDTYSLYKVLNARDPLTEEQKNQTIEILNRIDLPEPILRETSTEVPLKKNIPPFTMIKVDLTAEKINNTVVKRVAALNLDIKPATTYNPATAYNYGRTFNQLLSVDGNHFCHGRCRRSTQRIDLMRSIKDNQVLLRIKLWDIFIQTVNDLPVRGKYICVKKPSLRDLLECFFHNYRPIINSETPHTVLVLFSEIISLTVKLIYVDQNLKLLGFDTPTYYDFP
uniref:X protein n=3 Tax=unclassified Sigmavirus TaxID=1802944 RepID=A0AAU7L0G5_9RHAB